MKAEIISIGTEILLGEITDTNAPYIASRLPLLGIDLYWISQVGDNKERLIEALNRAWQRSDIILLTGGLGPTPDDVTREAVAEATAAVPAAVPAAPAPRGARALFPPVHSYELANGAALHVMPRREVPVVAARAGFAGGLLAEDAASSGLSSFLSCMWLRGTRGRSAADFARASESLAAEIDGFSGRSSLGLAEETPPALLVTDVLGRQHLQSDRAAQLLVFRLVDDAHAAFADPVDDPEVRQPLADHCFLRAPLFKASSQVL